VDEAANSLLALGVRPGDRIAVLFGNDPHWIVLALACSLVGATCVPINTWYKQSELGWLLQHSRISVLISMASFLKTDYRKLIMEVIPELAGATSTTLQLDRFPALRSVVIMGGTVPGAISYKDFLAAGRRASDHDVTDVAEAVDPDAPAYILYTSGSTAEPKGVLLNHRGVVQNGFDMGERRAVECDDRVWLGSPLFYGLGATNALPATFTRGAALVVHDWFDAERAITAIEKTCATVYYGTGNMTRAIIDAPGFSLARTGSLSKGNAGTLAEYKRLTLIEMGIKGAVPAYGLTESYGNVTVGRPDDPIEAKLRTNGTVLPGMEMRIVDPETGRDMPQGKTGLVLIRGYTTPGYLDNPEETAKALISDGFFNTGDLGFLDSDGRFVFNSRLKDVLKTGGINVSPLEIEQLLAGHPYVRDAHVVGVSDPIKGDRIVAFVDAIQPLDEDELRAYVRDRAASFKVPHHVFFRTEEHLPRLASGKVAKYKLMEEAYSELGAILP
jgi:fatty-acyl-CoA synthase